MSPLYDLDKGSEKITQTGPIVIAGDFNCGDVDRSTGIVKTYRPPDQKLVDRAP